MNSKNLLIIGAVLAIISVLVASGFAAVYFYGQQKNTALERAQLEEKARIAETDRQREALFAPQISAEGITCDMPAGADALSARRISFDIQGSDPAMLVQKILTFSKKYPTSSLALTSYATDSFSPANAYKSQYLAGFVPSANADEFSAFVKGLEDKKNTFITNTYTSTRPARDIYLDCVSGRNRIQSLAVKEAVYIDELKKGAFLDEKTLNNISEDLTNVRSDYSYMIHNGNVPDPLKIKEQLEGTVFTVSISDLKG